ncbi:MAG: ATP-binding protein [Halothiobacillaceae bacterium]|nr:MAG: ATP-binding protein [Halothiobacillaceae bacterium]
MDMPRHHLELTSRLEHLAGASEALRAFCANLPIPPSDLDRLDLALTEALTNVIEHAYKLEEHHSIHLDFLRGERNITVEISDEGLSLPPEMLISPPVARELARDNLDALPEGGWGLMLIFELCDNVEYQTHGGRNKLRLHVNFTQNPRPS